MKCLMVDSEASWRGGQGQVSLLMRGLLDEGVEVVLAAPPSSAIAARARDMGIEVLPLPVSGSIDIGAVWKLRRYLKKTCFDVVHCHSSHAHSIAFLAFQSLYPGMGVVAQRPLLVVSRRVDFKVATNSFSAFKYKHGADVYIAISNGVRDVLLAGGLDGDRVELVASGIDLAKFDHVKPNEYLYKDLGIAPGTAIVGNIAALAPHKSQDDFIRAAKIISDQQPNVRFLIVGEGDQRPSLEKLIAELGVERQVTLTGFREDVLEILSLLDCFVLSSHLEGLCTSIMDAHSAGIPVVATRTGGVPDLVEDGETGLLVTPHNPSELAAAIMRMAEDGALRQRCVDKARLRSREYDYTNMVRGTLGAYRHVKEKQVSNRS